LIAKRFEKSAIISEKSKNYCKNYWAINDTPRATDFAAGLKSGETATKQKPL
jgi:hypothetical protein